MDFPQLRPLLRPFFAPSSVQDERLYFSDPQYRAVPFDEKNFHPLPSDKSTSAVAFVDGGQCELLKSSNFSLQCIRACAIVYDKGKRVHFERNEFYVLISVTPKNGQLKYEVSLLDDPLLLGGPFYFDLEEAALRQGVYKVPVSRIGDALRRFAEIKMAEKMAGKLASGDVLILDGDLRSVLEQERVLFEKLFTGAGEKGIIVGGLCKTSTLLTDKGNSWSGFLRKKSAAGMWYYYPSVRITNPSHPVEMYFLKLSPFSSHIFRFEIHRENNPSLSSVLSLLAVHSGDPVFPGYPYGMIEADQWARISRQEEMSLKTQLRAYLGKEEAFAGEAAHDEDERSILDAIR